ncbi:Protein CBG25194 [Caenorhabditis briggsae]|uniref:Protein CBG25194 n=1 Tax=Caenorhabditis briggsae TaxID=6238 RepID=B6IJF3_CAEBR|nr:Protein CBG25194 [Caenorhabditis briggsae]CAS00033.1 Protein CBG25194 [Caenorhabditis briggsae]
MIFSIFLCFFWIACLFDLRRSEKLEKKFDRKKHISPYVFFEIFKTWGMFRGVSAPFLKHSLKIHFSQQTYDILMQEAGFKLELRGSVETDLSLSLSLSFRISSKSVFMCFLFRSTIFLCPPADMS